MHWPSFIVGMGAGASVLVFAYWLFIVRQPD